MPGAQTGAPIAAPTGKDSGAITSEVKSAAPQSGGFNSTDEVIQSGDEVYITFADTISPIPPVQGKIRDDGTITVIYNQNFHAAGKAAGQLAKEIRDFYVPKYFVNLTVTVSHTPNMRFYYVDGEVRAPSRQVYIGRTSVLKAIASCGGFTDFANKKKVKLTRANGRKEIVNCVKALDDDKLDLQVFPNDKIVVPRKIF
jgi:protein involved in polysaccharide export with SLBB domain